MPGGRLSRTGNEMTAPADFIEEGDAGGRTVRFTGSLTLAGLNDLPERLATLTGPVARIGSSRTGAATE